MLEDKVGSAAFWIVLGLLMAPSKNMILAIHFLNCQYICIAAWILIEELMDRLQQTWVEKPLRESDEVKHDIRIEILKNLTSSDEHCYNMKVHFNQCHELFKNKSGIAWSSSSKMFEADNNVWDELIAANPSMKKWRNTPINNYDKLVELFSKDRAVGNMVGTPKDINMNLSTPVREEGNDDIAFNVQQSDNIKDVASSSSIPQSQGNNTTATSSRTSKRKYDDSVLKVTNENIQMLMSSMEKNTNVLVNAVNPAQLVEKEYTKTEIFEELNKLNLPRETLINAYILLGTNKEKTQLFFSAPDWLRGEILSRLMN